MPLSEARPLAPRRVRSYVLRSGRMTDGQRRALVGLWEQFGLRALPTDPVSVFGRAAPCVLEIGFGNGEGLLQRAAARPDRDYLGVEVHRPGIGHALLGLARNRLDNVRLVEADAALAISATGQVFSEICVWFPDPWPKKRHHKRRLIQPEFIAQLARVLRPGGLLHLATDDEGYAEVMQTAVTSSDRFARHPCPEGSRPDTRFARRARAAGRTIADLCYLRLDQDT
ncbi:MAG: tRNA (guanosine(46)-N7)-methyltransferase TrmB [Acidiferrobacteraceae bacterium]